MHPAGHVPDKAPQTPLLHICVMGPPPQQHVAAMVVPGATGGNTGAGNAFAAVAISGVDAHGAGHVPETAPHVPSVHV